MSNIEWTEKSWNPFGGCSKVSPGCANCYAEGMARQLGRAGVPKYEGTVNGKWTGVVNFDKTALQIPVNRKKPTTYFVNSTSDMFHDKVQVGWLQQCWQVMADTPQHTYQILTKRAENMMSYVSFLAKSFGILPNVWIGVSVENQKYADQRIPYLIDTPAKIKFLSCEPLLAEVTIAKWLPFEIGWVIVGGETGPKARPTSIEWVRNLRNECNEANVPFFFKKWQWLPVEVAGDGMWRDQAGNFYLKTELPTAEERGQTWIGDYENGIVCRKARKSDNVRLVDGREWNEMPVRKVA